MSTGNPMGMLKSCSNASSGGENERNAAQIERLLEAEASRPANRNWPRLDNTERAALLREFAVRYCADEECDERSDELSAFLLVALTRKRLSRVKDVEYDRASGSIVRVHGLSLNDDTQRFTLHRTKVTVRPTIVSSSNTEGEPKSPVLSKLKEMN